MTKSLDEYKRTFGLRLEQRVLEKRLTQAELGAAVGRSQQSVSKWYKGTKLPKLDTVRRLAQILETPVEWFFDLPNEGAVAYTCYGGVELTAAEEMGVTRQGAEDQLMQELQRLAPDVTTLGSALVRPGQPFEAHVLTVAPGTPEQQLRHLRARLWPLAVQRRRNAATGRQVVVVLALAVSGGYAPPSPVAVDLVTREAAVLGLELYAAATPRHVLDIVQFLAEALDLSAVV